VEHIIFPLHIPPPETHRSSNLPQNLQPLWWEIDHHNYLCMVEGQVQPHSAELEDVLPLAFPFGSGGPTNKRKVKVSLVECIKRYMRVPPCHSSWEVMLFL
jgi:hypothetical protein